MLTGGCHCGAVRYEADAKPLHHAICHCVDCRRCAGAPMVGWIAFPADQVRLTEGETAIYAGSEHGRRHFCIQCGTGMFYFNDEALPGIVDIQSATLDDAEAHAPSAHIQMAEVLPWVATMDSLPKFDRFPPME